MSFCPSNFNGEAFFRCRIIWLLNKYIFTNSKCQLCRRYYRMQKDVQKSPYDKSEFEKEYAIETGGLMLQEEFQSHVWSACKNIGHDLPIWINANDDDLCKDTAKESEEACSSAFRLYKKITDIHLVHNRTTVMLIGIDPLRKNGDIGSISLSTPWGVHSPKYRTRKNSSAQRMWALMSHFNQNGYNVYVTDRNKLFAAEKINTKHVTTKKVDMLPFPATMTDCLCKEIGLVRPDIVIFIGGGIQDFLINGFLYAAYRQYPTASFFHIPHPRTMWKDAIISYVKNIRSTFPVDIDLETYALP